MFVVRDWTRNPSYTMVSNDVKDVRDIVISITGDETIGDHVLLHLGHMIFGQFLVWGPLVIRRVPDEDAQALYLNGEAGEAIDLMKKVLFQGHEFDREHMAKELGDIAWYLAVSADAIGYDLESILQMNVDKLRARYPDGFSMEQSLHRSANDI